MFGSSIKNRWHYLWQSFCYKQWLRYELSPDHPMYRLAALYLNEAQKRGAERIVLGALPDDYTIKERYDDAQDALGDEDLAELREKHDFKPEDCVIDPRDHRMAFSDSVAIVGNIPFWYCHERKGYQGRSLPLQMYQPLIEIYLRHEASGVYISEFSDGPSRVFYRIGLQENFCYYIRITKVEKEPSKRVQRTR